MSSLAFDQAKSDLLTGVYNLSTGTYKALLVQTGYVPVGSDTFVSAITGGATNYELNSGGGGTGYQAGFAGTGRLALASLAVSINGTSHYAYWTAANSLWTAISAGTARAAAIYKPGTSDTDSKMLFYVQFPTDVLTNGGNLTITWSTNGIVQLS